MEALFFVVFGLIVYTYIGYPLLLLIRRRVDFVKDDDFQPAVSFIITAHNEANVIESKLRNSLSLKYPKNKIEFILASDGSTDRTVEIASRFEGVEVLDLERRGKTACQNKAVEMASGDFIVFSDANSRYSQDAVRKLVRNFKDPRVGAVCGELRYDEAIGRESLYWKYEVTLKRLEGRSGDLLGANGSIYAVRRENFSPLAQDAISDFLEPIIIHAKGKKAVYEREAVAWEEEPDNTFQRKRRIVLRTLTTLSYLKPFLNPFRYGSLSWSLFSHKIVRWFMPYFFVLLALLNLFLLNMDVFRVTFMGQIVFYGSAIFSKSVRYFIVVNCASFVSIVDWIRGKRRIVWQVDR